MAALVRKKRAHFIPARPRAFVWDHGIRIIGITLVSVCLGAVLISEYLDMQIALNNPRRADKAPSC